MTRLSLQGGQNMSTVEITWVAKLLREMLRGKSWHLEGSRDETHAIFDRSLPSQQIRRTKTKEGVERKSGEGCLWVKVEVFRQTTGWEGTWPYNT